MFTKSLYFLLTLSLAFAASDDSTIKLTLSTSTTEAVVGKPFNVHCDLSTFVSGLNDYRVYLYVDNHELFGHYIIHVSDKSTPPKVTSFSAFKEWGVTVTPHTHNLTSYGFSVATLDAGSHQFHCVLDHFTGALPLKLKIESNKVKVISTKPSIFLKMN